MSVTTENNVAAQAGDEPMQVGWLNVQYGTFFRLGELAASERTTEMLISGEVIRVYSGPGAKWACPDCGNASRFDHRGCIMSVSPRATADVERDAARFRSAIALDDNAGALYAAVLSYGPDESAIRAAFDSDISQT